MERLLVAVGVEHRAGCRTKIRLHDIGVYGQTAKYAKHC